MKILLISPPWLSVPPKAYGGIEWVVAILADGLVKKGYKVDLFATGDSNTKANLRYVFDSAKSSKLGTSSMSIYDSIHISEAFKIMDGYDIVHDHSGFLVVAFSYLTNIPILHTLHGPFNEDTKAFYGHFKDSCYFNAISEYQKKSFPILNYVDTVYNAIDVDNYPYSEQKEDYLLMVSRVNPSKGTHLAVQVAKSLGEKLILAGKIDPQDKVYFTEKVKPHIDGEQIVFLGEVSEIEKRQLMKSAKCFLFPIQWPEPFGLVMTEAMACGTPVVALRDGSVPEVIVDGRVGYIVDSVDEMVEAVRDAKKISPKACRDHVITNFSPERMVEKYVTNYEKILGGLEGI
ncbi:MAG: glycosyltransferase family 4 protein [Actinomycetota bacterium]